MELHKIGFSWADDEAPQNRETKWKTCTLDAHARNCRFNAGLCWDGYNLQEGFMVKTSLSRQEASTTVALMVSKQGTDNPDAVRPMHLLRCNPPEVILKIWKNTERNPRPDARAIYDPATGDAESQLKKTVFCDPVTAGAD